MGLFSNDSTVKTTFVGEDKLSPVVRNVRSALGDFKKDVITGVGLGAGLNLFSSAQQALGFVTSAIGDATTAFREDEVSQRQLNAALEANIESWDGNTKAIEDVIAARMKLGFSDDDQRKSLAELIAITKDASQALDIQRTAMDLARLKGTDLETAALALGKAWAGSTTALQRMGIKLDAGVKGMDALAEVQKRVTGQAEAFASTSAGAAEVFNVKVGELQESLGRLISGPAGMFLGWLSNVADVLSGPQGANKEISDFADNIGKTHQAAKEAAQPIQMMSDRLQTSVDHLNQLQYAITQNSFDWLTRLGPAMVAQAEAAGTTIDYMAKLANSVAEAGGSFDDFEYQMRVFLQTQTGTADVVTGTWGATATSVQRSAGTVKVALRSIPRAVTHAVVDMEQTIGDGKDRITKEFQDLAWQSKHPFANTNYAAWLKQKQAAAVAEMRQAVKDGRPDIVAQYRALIADIQDELQGLPGYAEQVAQDAIASLGAVGTTTTRVWKRTHKKKNAIGGMTSGVSLTGEYGPEVVEWGSAKAHVQPTQASHGGGDVYLDGQKVGRWVDRYIDRQLQIG